LLCHLDALRVGSAPLAGSTAAFAKLYGLAQQVAGPPLRRDMKSSFTVRRLLAAMILLAGSLGVLRANSGRTDGDSGWGFSEANLDRSCKPCDDFNQFAMGGWMKNNPIPAEYPNWGSFTMLADRNQTVLRTILEDAAKSNAAAGSNQQK